MPMKDPFKDTILCKITEFLSSVRFNDLPLNVIKKTRQTLMDFLVVLCVGFHEGVLSDLINSYILSIGGKEESTILCLGKKLPAVWASLSMGVMAHAVELDDGHRWGTSHPAVAVIPAVLSFAEKEGKVSFLEIIPAIVVGYEMMLRVARAINPSHLKRGFHSTGTCGSLGSSCGCAYLAGFDSVDMAYAVSIGGLQSAGLQEMLHDNPSIKPLQPGKSALAGIIAVDLVKRGARAPRTLFEGEHGWLKAMCDEYSIDALLSDFGKRWEINYCYTKFYPTCRHCHASIDLALEAKQRLKFSAEDIKEVIIRIYSLGYKEVGQIVCPKNLEEAMFSLPFSVALALKNGRLTLKDFNQKNISDPLLKAIAKRVKVEVDPKMDDLYPKERGAYLKLVLKDGRTFEKYIPVAKGEPENPATLQDLWNKFLLLLLPYYPESFLEELWDVCIEKDIKKASYKEIIDIFGRYHNL